MKIDREALVNIIAEELEIVLEAKYHWNEPDWHYDGGYGDPESPHAKWYLKKERKLTDAEYKKKGEVAKAIKKDNPGMSDEDVYPIATATAKRVAEGDPKKGTGKKPKGSKRRLYTDEDPSDTVSVKFSTVQDIKDTLSKSSFKSKSHKRQSQIINLIHQRARAAYKNAKDPKVKARLKKSYEYAEKRKEASKRKTIQLRKKKK